MVCRCINSICPIHAFLLSRSVQATGGGSCWAVLPILIYKGYKLHYPAQSEPAWTAPSIHSLFFCLPFSFSPNAASSISLPPVLHPSRHFLLSWWLMGVVHGALSISFHRNTYIGKQTHIACARSETPAHTNKTSARQKQQREPCRLNGKTSHSVRVRQH